MAKSTELEVEKMKLLDKRIKAPSIWGQAQCGVKFEDLQEHRYEEAVELLKEYYLPEEVPFKSLQIHKDEEATEEYLNNIRIGLKDKMSIAAVEEDTDNLVGVLIMRIQDRGAFSRTFSRIKLTYNILYTKVMKFYNNVENPVDMFEKLGVKRYIKIYAIALTTKYRHKGLAKEMLTATMGPAKIAKVPGLAGVFTTKRLQQVAEELGFMKYHEISYDAYHEDGKVVFSDVSSDNISAAFMGYRIPGVMELEEFYIQPSSRFNLKSLDLDENET